MQTETEIVNAALRRVGARRIVDVSENVASAGIAKDVLVEVRDNMLRAAAWNFATTRARLARLTAVPVSRFQFGYALPSDWLRTLEVADNSGGTGTVPYKQEALQLEDSSFIQAILCSAEQVYLRYVRLVEEPANWSASFQSLVVLGLAKVFAPSIAKSNTLLVAIDSELKAAMKQARAIDGMEDFPDRLPEGSWVTSRRGYRRDRDWSNLGDEG